MKHRARRVENTSKGEEREEGRRTKEGGGERRNSTRLHQGAVNTARESRGCLYVRSGAAKGRKGERRRSRRVRLGRFCSRQGRAISSRIATREINISRASTQCTVANLFRRSAGNAVRDFAAALGRRVGAKNFRSAPSLALLASSALLGRILWRCYFGV